MFEVPKNEQKVNRSPEYLDVSSTVSLADEVLIEQMKRSGYEVYENGGQIYIKAVAALAAGIMGKDLPKEVIVESVSLADEVLIEQMKRSGYKVYENGGQIYIEAVAALAAEILKAETESLPKM